MSIKNLRELSLEQQASELFLVKINDNNLTEKERRIIEDIAPGGFLLSSNTLNTIRVGKDVCGELEKILQVSRKTSPFLAVEHEGGGISVLSQEATPTPSAMAIGATGLTNFAYTVAYITALELRAIGINMNFSPLIEFANFNNDRLSRSRSFWDDPKDAEQFVLKYIHGLKNGGIVSVAKYFPSYSLIKKNKDGEFEISVDDVRHEIPILRNVILNKVDGLMVSHITVVSKKQKRLPAFLSKEIIKEILVNNLGFQGLVITEPLSRKETLEKYSLEEAAIEAIEAGNDILVIDEKLDELYKLRETIVKKARRDSFLARRIKNAFTKTIKKKHSYLRYFRKPTLQVIGCKKHRVEVEKIAKKSVGLVFDNGLLPLKPHTQIIITLVFASSEVFNIILNLAEQLGFKKANIFLVKEENTPILTTKIRRANAVVVFTQNLFNKTKERHEISDIIEQNEKNILISIDDPCDIAFVRRPCTYIVTYSPDFYSIKAALEVLVGKLKPTGRIPKTLIEIINRGGYDEKSES